MAMQLCPAHKHYFDAALHAECPYCQETAPVVPMAAPAASAKTQVVPAAVAAKTQPVGNLQTADAGTKTVILGTGATGVPAAEVLPVVGWLVIIDGPGRGRDFRLVQGENRIGRQAGLEVCLDFGDGADAAVSREPHACVVFDHHVQEFFIERGSSRNLPLLNGSSIRGEPTLQAYDVIQVGATRLLFVPLCHAGRHWDGDMASVVAA